MNEFKILIVDDSETVRDVIAKTLEITGYPESAVVHAANGKEALQQISKEKIGLVFSDLHMPEMNGVEMITLLKSQGATRHIPIVVISSDGSTARMNQLQEDGVVDYISKPFTPEQVRGVITRILGNIDDN